MSDRRRPAIPLWLVEGSYTTDCGSRRQSFSELVPAVDGQTAVDVVRSRFPDAQWSVIMAHYAGKQHVLFEEES